MKDEDAPRTAAGSSPAGTESARRELDRHIFHQKMLYDTTRELNRLREPRQIIETFLLMTMGMLGISQGFILLVDSETLVGELASRGLEPEDMRRIKTNCTKIKQHYLFLHTSAAHQSSEALLLTRDGVPSDYGLFPDCARVLVQWTSDRDYAGILGLGDKLTGVPIDDEETELLLGLTNTLIASVQNAHSAQAVEQFKQDLRKKSNEMEEVVRQAERMQRELDRRVFHLKTLYDVTRELSGLSETRSIMETFLLLTMGTFSAQEGYVLVFDKTEKTGHVTYRSLEKEKRRELPPQEIETLLTQFSGVARERRLEPLSALPVSDRKLLSHPILPVAATVGVLFSVDECCLGFVGLGNKITEERYSDKEQDLLLTMVNNLIVFLDNARSFEMIRKLNLDLENRNIELRRTIDELTVSRMKIEVLEKAKAHIKSVIQREAERIGRVSAMDFLLIVGLGLILGVLFNLANPSGIALTPQSWSRSGPRMVDAYQAKARFDTGGVVFLDARPTEFFDRGHVPGAINLPPSLFDFVYMMKLSRFEPEKEIIVYGRNISRRYDEEIASKLAARGHKNVRVLSGCLGAWMKSGFPIE